MKYLLIGWGISNQAVYQKIKNENEVLVYDDLVKDDIVVTYEYLKRELPLFDIGILSPGFDIRNEKYRLIKSLCRQVISEIDFAYSQKKMNIIAITGSNGKTTLTTFLNEFLSIKYKTHICGNIGIPLTSILDEINEQDLVVLELSSFQIRDSSNLKINQLFYTSLSKNHADHYDSERHYYADKKRCLLLMNTDNVLYCDEYNFDEYFNLSNTSEILSHIDGKYGKKYAVIAMNYALKLGIDKAKIIEKAKTLTPVKYRMNPIIKYGNKIFVNDSKSTTVASTIYCYETFANKGKIILILGGISKSQSFEELHVKDADVIYIYGRDKTKICGECKGVIKDSLEEIISDITKINDECYILFSPGCSSYDQYNSYIERGEHFNSLIKYYFER